MVLGVGANSRMPVDDDSIPLILSLQLWSEYADMCNYGRVVAGPRRSRWWKQVLSSMGNGEVALLLVSKRVLLSCGGFTHLLAVLDLL